ncbi:DUF5677 domain-containing protein [Rhodococcus pyridinivorans]|uniref:DUF5677 domain-containing protein n=1 Tax=Rhodococcus pyridinivorans TaxID=103816 RepID=UPI0022851BF4|nr:DUF5677 domain-containing protein [Rhodococcus pyridinivorans]WAL49629.1 DUF5677 domain-containing protein [Rhodococcus pyridinivorans]
MANKKSGQVRAGALGDHTRRGKVFVPPLLSMPVPTEVLDHLRDDLPDLLWPVCLSALGGDHAAGGLVKLQEAMADLDPPLFPGGSRAFEMRLTSLEAIREEVRSQVLGIAVDIIDRHALLPDLVLSALRFYPDLPGRWLLVDPWSDRVIADDGESLAFLANAVRDYALDGHVQAIAKFFQISWDVLRGKASFGKDVAELLKPYPGDPATRNIADSAIRSIWGVTKGALYMADADLQSQHVDWSRRFWKRNWAISKCVTAAMLDPDGESPPAKGCEDDQRIPDRTKLDVEELQRVADEELDYLAKVNERFLDAVFNPDRSCDLYEPAKEEVICGIISRLVRSAGSFTQSPTRWTVEESAHVVRMMVEAEIVLDWMATQPLAIYDKFQKYGEGRRKLMRLHLTDLAATTDGYETDKLTDEIERLGRKTGGEWGEGFTEVSIESTFAGISLRTMAAATGHEAFYRTRFQVASGIVHGEWWAIEDFAMHHCLNPLHRFHRIPSQFFDRDPELVSEITEYFALLCDKALQHMGIAVDAESESISGAVPESEESA